MSADSRYACLVDASIYIFRAYYSVPDTLFNDDGQLINALHGFAGFLSGLLEEAGPRHIAVAFDESLTTSYRNEIYPAYKANRESPPEELKQQFALCKTLVEALGIAHFSSPVLEADDLIGTLAARLREDGLRVAILSADKDLAQLLEPGDMLWDYSRRRKHHYDKVHEWLGVRPEQVADWLALTGDAVDNIPGVPGIGAKTAAALLAEFDSLDELYREPERVGTMKLRGAARIQRLLQEHRDTVMLARQLTGIETGHAVDAGSADLVRRNVSSDSVSEACERLGLGRMTTARLLRTL